MFNLKISTILENKKYMLAYIIGILFVCAIFFKLNNLTNLKMEFLIVIILILIGIFIISFSKDNELYKTSLIIILIFGLLMCFTTPTLIVCDEIEHYARSDITSNGVLIPEYINNEGYEVSGSFNQLLSHTGETLTHNTLINEKISTNTTLFDGCFAQNPFYPYIFSALGILLAKLLDLSIMWSVWLGRIFNLLFYAAICSYAIKKVPEYKIPLFAVSCIPLAVYQASSFNADCFIISVTILAIAYFIYMYKSEKVTNKDLGIFFTAILLVSLLKLPYALLGFLIFFIKKEKFESDKIFIISRIIPFILLVICSIYSLNASQLLQNSIRKEHFIQDNVSVSGQISFITNHPSHILSLLSTFDYFTLDMIYDIFRFSYQQWTYESKIMAILYFIYFCLLCITYDDVKLAFKRKYKVILAIILLLIYFGIITIQYLSWAPVGYPRLDMIIGVYIRYFIPLLAFFPLIFNSKRISSMLKIKNYNLVIVVETTLFLSACIIFTMATFY